MRSAQSGWLIILGMLLVGSIAATASVVEAVGPPPRWPPVLALDPPAAETGGLPTIEQLVGQKLVITMRGRRPSAALIRRVRRGEIGGVVLIGRNITTRKALRRSTRALQRAAADGGQPPLLIAVDQEGGSVRRVPWAGPTLSVPEMGRVGSTQVARRQGRDTGAALHRVGINVDLAPVADVPRSITSFMYQQGRTFSMDARRTSRLADAFAEGLASRGVLATMKHFPGIGLATRNTDKLVETIRAPRSVLRDDLRPYRRAIAGDIPLIMLSNARYPAYDRRDAAGWSRAISVELLRGELGFTGVTITDSLNGTANARNKTVPALAIRAARAGTDMILMTGSERSSSRLFRLLVAAAEEGSIPMDRLTDSYDRILALKADL